ncbi:MAG: hypothetical protein E7330_05600 [Clostridiales bacterium]|nr:hypothetical protein [Clostridiales bacterium]
METKRNFLDRLINRQQEEVPAIEPLKLITFIVNRGAAEHVTKLCLDHRIALHLTLRGHGTADSKIIDYLGLGETEKDVVLACVPASAMMPFMQEVCDALQLEKPGNGIAFSIPLSSLAERAALDLISGFTAKEEK